MRAIDTNIVIRAVTADDPKQTEQVRALLLENDLFVPITVVLEAEWVLRSTYGFSPDQIVAGLETFMRFPKVHVQHAVEVSKALDYVTGGLDLADALHIALSTGCTDFVTFDGPCRRAAASLASLPVVKP